MSDDGVLEWAKRQRTAWKGELRFLQEGKMFTSEERDGKMVDTTAATMAEVSQRLSELEKLILRHEAR